MRSPHPSTTGRLALLVATLAGSLLSVAGPASAANGATLGISPADEPDFFHVELTAGGTSRRTAVVSNNSSTVQRIAIYPADGLTTPQGGFTVKAQQQPRTEVGAWTHLPITSLTLPAGGKRRVSFDVTVPTGTSPGDYSGGIVVQSQPRTGQTSQLDRQTAVQLNLIERVAARIYLHVAGTARPALSIGTLTSTPDGSARNFAVTVTNTGNMRLKPAGLLGLDGNPGAPVTLTLSAIDTLLPGGQVVLRARWTNPPAVFWGQATATIRSQAGTTHAQTTLHLIPIAPTAIALGLLILLAWAAVHAARYLRRARAALRNQPPRTTPNRTPTTPSPTTAGASINRTGPARPRPGRHRHSRA